MPTQFYPYKFMPTSPFEATPNAHLPIPGDHMTCQQLHISSKKGPDPGRHQNIPNFHCFLVDPADARVIPRSDTFFLVGRFDYVLLVPFQLYQVLPL